MDQLQLSVCVYIGHSSDGNDYLAVYAMLHHPDFPFLSRNVKWAITGVSVCSLAAAGAAQLAASCQLRRLLALHYWSSSLLHAPIFFDMSAVLGI